MWKWIKRVLGFGHENEGHRLWYKDFLENSIHAFDIGLFHQNNEYFKYWEFDVVESVDGILFVFHDATKRKTIKRMCPTAPKHLINKSIYELTAKEIESLTLKDSHYRIPRLMYLMKMFSENRVTKPILVEIKRLHSRQAKKNLVSIISTFKDSNRDVDIKFGMSKKKFRKVFKDDKAWFLSLLSKNDLELKVW